MRAYGWRSFASQQSRGTGTTYSDVHFVLLMWIHLDVLTSDILCPKVDSLRGELSWQWICLRSDVLLFSWIGSEWCSIEVFALSLGNCFLVVKSTKLIPDHASAGKMIGCPDCRYADHETFDCKQPLDIFVTEIR